MMKLGGNDANSQQEMSSSVVLPADAL